MVASVVATVCQYLRGEILLKHSGCADSGEKYRRTTIGYTAGSESTKKRDSECIRVRNCDRFWNQELDVGRAVSQPFGILPGSPNQVPRVFFFRLATSVSDSSKSSTSTPLLELLERETLYVSEFFCQELVNLPFFNSFSNFGFVSPFVSPSLREHAVPSLCIYSV